MPMKRERREGKWEAEGREVTTTWGRKEGKSMRPVASFTLIL